MLFNTRNLNTSPSGSKNALSIIIYPFFPCSNIPSPCKAIFVKGYFISYSAYSKKTLFEILSFFFLYKMNRGKHIYISRHIIQIDPLPLKVKNYLIYFLNSVPTSNYSNYRRNQPNYYNYEVYKFNNYIIGDFHESTVLNNASPI